MNETGVTTPSGHRQAMRGSRTTPRQGVRHGGNNKPICVRADSVVRGRRTTNARVRPPRRKQPTARIIFSACPKGWRYEHYLIYPRLLLTKCTRYNKRDDINFTSLLITLIPETSTRRHAQARALVTMADTTYRVLLIKKEYNEITV
ncbi:hypothetical protein EVAR_57790_1 [Eumeta japonica]|uniref:Uncharacterized protein n=1 Tax=Eumeta variegata TaxID=151549 RepID=A0A4C1Y858_EUMVA|nr:hypothetical protein EVAR_57790_1 [Eumeta japonica]